MVSTGPLRSRTLTLLCLRLVLLLVDRKDVDCADAFVRLLGDGIRVASLVMPQLPRNELLQLTLLIEIHFLIN